MGLWDLLRSVGLGSDAGVVETVAALVVHRAVAPDSKLAATRWYGTTVLPQWLGLSGEQFNDSRVHRVLDRLEQCREALQEQLAPHLESRAGGFVVLFNDITQVAFEGRGPELLALLVQRWMEHHLRTVGLPLTAKVCLETLKTSYINELRAPWGDSFTLTDTNDEQRAILRALDLEHLADHGTVGARLHAN